MINDTMVIKKGLTGTVTTEDGESAIQLCGRGDNYEELDVTIKERDLKAMLKLLEGKNDRS